MSFRLIPNSLILLYNSVVFIILCFITLKIACLLIQKHTPLRRMSEMILVAFGRGLKRHYKCHCDLNHILILGHRRNSLPFLIIQKNLLFPNWFVKAKLSIISIVMDIAAFYHIRIFLYGI